VKLQELWKQHEEYTRETSTIARQLAFGAAAISWLFKTIGPGHIFPTLILYAICFTVAFFMVDLLQYFTASLLHRFWIRGKEKHRWRIEDTIEGDYEKPVWLDYPAFSFWLLKIVLLLIAYTYIGLYLIQVVGTK
jgi:hypothetical protein